MRVLILGAGLIGKKRADAVRAAGGVVAGIADLDLARAQALAAGFGAAVYPSAEIAISACDADAVIVATSNNVLSPLAAEAMRSGKHVLVEKPAGRNPQELQHLVRTAEQTRRTCRIGFNHRFHPGMQKLARYFREGAVGELMYVRARYGHGGRPGYDREWRAVPELSGGGELMDQGVHLIDLCRWLAGDFSLEYGLTKTVFWNMPVEDNGFLALRNSAGAIAWLHASCTEWKNLFDFELYGKLGKLQVTGLGKSYGPEEFKFYRRNLAGGAPSLESEVFPEEDHSWTLETASFFAEATGQKGDCATAEDALQTVEIVYSTYLSH